MKKKTVKKIVCLSLIAISITAIVYAATIIGRITVFDSYETRAVVDKNNFTINCESDDIKILILSDLQFSNYIEMAWAFSAAKRVLKKTTPDLILTTGDNFGNNVTEKHLNALVKFMDSFGVLWGVTFGNHDYNSKFTPQDYVKACTESKNGILYSTEISDSYSNYFYKITLDGEDAAMIFCFDTKKDGLTDKHVKWYENTLTQNAYNGDKVLQSFAFFHIPPEETEVAAKLYEQDKSLGSGNIIDEVRKQSTACGFIDKAIELQSTKAVFYGHDHRNNAHISYRGIKLCYAMKTGKTVYDEKGSTGGTLLTVGKDGFFDIERISVGV